jgi:hypothetical protein
MAESPLCSAPNGADRSLLANFPTLKRGANSRCASGAIGMGTTRVNNLDSCDYSLGWVPPGGILEANSFLSISYEMGCVVKSSFRRGYSQNLLNKGVRAHFASIGTCFRRNWTVARNAMPAACAYARSVKVQVTSHYEPGPGNFMQRQGLARWDRMNAFKVLSLFRSALTGRTDATNMRLPWLFSMRSLWDERAHLIG